LKPHGRLLAVEPAASFSGGIDEELRRRVHGQRNPRVGRELPALVAKAGLRLRKIIPHAFVDDAPSETRALRERFERDEGLFALARRAGLCSLRDVEDYLRLHDEAVSAGVFYDCVVHLAVLAERPHDGS
jgi:hypothetical protein